MESVTLSLPDDLARDLAGLATSDGRSVTDEGLLLLRRAVAARRLHDILDRCGSEVDADEAMRIALDEERAAHRAR